MCHVTWYDAYQVYTNKEEWNRGMLSNRLGLPKGYNRSKIDTLSMLHGEGISINTS